MTIGEMIGRAFISPEIEDRVFFKVAVVKDVTKNYTLVEYDNYIFENGKGLISIKSDHSHITVFNRFYEDRLSLSHKAITIIFGGIAPEAI